MVTGKRQNLFILTTVDPNSGFDEFFCVRVRSRRYFDNFQYSTLTGFSDGHQFYNLRVGVRQVLQVNEKVWNKIIILTSGTGIGVHPKKPRVDTPASDVLFSELCTYLLQYEM